MSCLDFPPLVFWLEKQDIGSIPTSAYWNNEIHDRGQEYDVRGGDSTKLEKYLQTTGLRDDFLRAVEETERWMGHSLSGVGLDVASGVGWANAMLSRQPQIKRIFSVDISLHRLQELAPWVCDALGGEAPKIIRVVGNFYHLKLPDGSVDFCLMSQALHHADDPRALLAECRRVLRVKGCILVFGERPITRSYLLVMWIRHLVKRFLPDRWLKNPPARRWFPSFRELFPPDRILGDHFYREEDYRALFDDVSLEWRCFPTGRGRVVFVLRKPEEARPGAADGG